jgi:hypothetical protein
VTDLRARVRTEHARIGKKIINFDTGGYGICAWSDCYKDACSLHEVRQHEHARSVACDGPLGRHVTYAFCTDRHKQYWLAGTGEMAHDTSARNNGRISGMLPPGLRRTLQ